MQVYIATPSCPDVYTYIHIDMYICIYMCMYTYRYMYVDIYIYIYRYLRLHPAQMLASRGETPHSNCLCRTPHIACLASLCVCVNVCVRMCVCTCASVYKYKYLYMYIAVYAALLTSRVSHPCVCVWMCLCANV